MSSIITLTTDFGIEDAYIGIMKGVIYSIDKKAKIIDITHYIEPQNIRQGAWVLSNSYSYFPDGTIHTIVVDPGVGSSRKAIAVKTKKYYFIAPDNGVLSYALEKESIIDIRVLDNSEYHLKNISNTFHGRDIFAPVSAYLSKGIPFSEIGSKIKNYTKIPYPKLKVSPSKIIGEIVYIDHFGNLITNIPQNILKNKNKEKTVITVGDIKIFGIKNHYQEVNKGEYLALIGSSGHLEISINSGNAHLTSGISEEKEVILQPESRMQNRKMKSRKQEREKRT